MILRSLLVSQLIISKNESFSALNIEAFLKQVGSLSFTVSETVPSDRGKSPSQQTWPRVQELFFLTAIANSFWHRWEKNNFIFCAVSKAVITGNKTVSPMNKWLKNFPPEDGTWYRKLVITPCRIFVIAYIFEVRLCGNMCKKNMVWLTVLSAGVPHQQNPPSEVLVVTGVELGVGLSVALVTLVFFLHSNATWSLHSLWQFIPQSVQAQKNARHVTTGTEVNLASINWLLTSLWTLSVLQMQLSDSCFCMLTVKQTNSSQIFRRTGEGEENCGSQCSLFLSCAARFN